MVSGRDVTKHGMNEWRQRVRQLKRETYALYLAYKDPRVPWFARLWVAIVVGYALSPIDLIPDFIPIFGYLDDLVLIPLGVLVAIKLIPPHLMEECREQAQIELAGDRPVNWIAAVVIVSLWLLAAVLIVCLIVRVFR
ncbi:MAG: YkvA family protein [Candidatus Promineifilaceae bacterium]